MNRSLLTILAAVSLAAVVAPGLARAEDEVVERVVVRNRKYHLANRLELTPAVGFSLTNRMSQHTNFQLGVAYNFSDEWALEARGGYALNDLSDVAKEVQQRPRTDLEFDDFSDLWRTNWQALLMPRWSPVYGKINLVTELPIHFQAFVTAGGGAVGLTRESVTYLQSGTYLSEEKTTWAAAAGGGLRFFASDLVMVRLELFDVMFPDSYREGFPRAESEAEPAGSEPRQGEVVEGEFSHVLFFNLGASFVF